MGRRKNRTNSGPRKGEQVEGREKGKELVVSFVKDNDNSTAEKEEEMLFEKIIERTDLVSEIFSRLAPQTLFRFTCVSKGFCNLIRQPDFAARHYRNCKAIAGRALTGLFFQNHYHLEESWSEPLVHQFFPVVLEAGGLPDPSLQFLKQKGKTDVVDIIDSCNGLLLCSNTTYGSNVTTCFVCNPLTKENIALPHPRKPSKRVSYALMSGLDRNYLKYKVICLVRPKNSGDGFSELSILSSETGEWMELVQKLPPASCEFVGGSKVFFNGSLYWDCLEGHILVCHLNAKQRQPCYKLIEAPRAPLGRCLWNSEDKLHCYCHGFGDDFPAWTRSKTDEQESRWQLEDCEQFRNLTDDVIALCTYQSVTERNTKPRIQFKIISYAPESKTLFLLIRGDIYTYQFIERRLEYLGGAHTCGGRILYSHCFVLPYMHSLVHIQTAKVADAEAERGIGMPIQSGRADGEAETGSETKNVRGRRNRKTPRFQDFSLQD